MPVLGIGGVFFRAQNPDVLNAWYRDHLGVDGYSWTVQAGPLVFAPFESDTDYWGPDKQFMLNLRVTDLAGLLDQLRADGIDVVENPEWNSPEAGRFARVHDPEGNAIELWEPPAS